jgi:cytochrome c-type biogenesis protein CcmH/NrfG
MEPLERAAEMAEDGNGYVRLSHVYMQAERWKDALGALDEAFKYVDRAEAVAAGEQPG